MKGPDDDLYVGKDGSVYKREEDGWYKGDDGDWKKAEMSEDQRGQLEERQKTTQENRAAQGEARATAQSKEDLKNRADAADLQSKRENIKPEQKAQAQARVGERQSAGSELQRGKASQFDRSQLTGGSNVDKLNRDYRARSEGTRRSQDYKSWRQNRSRSGARSGGARRGGGRRRR